VTASSLLVVDSEGNVLRGKGAPESTAFYIHSVSLTILQEPLFIWAFGLVPTSALRTLVSRVGGPLHVRFQQVLNASEGLGFR